MTPTTRRELLIGGAGLGIAGLSYAAEPRRVVMDFGRARLGDLIPLVVGGRSGVDDAFVVPEQVDATPTASETLSRAYAEVPSPIMLVVAYHTPQSAELKVHRPETCYAVAGFKVSAREPTLVSLRRAAKVPSVSYEGRRGDRTEVVLYWTRVATSFPQSLPSQRAAFLRQALAGIRADGLLVRLSTVSNDTQDARRRLDAFAADLVAASSPRGRALLLGPALTAAWT